MQSQALKTGLGIVFLVIALVFVYRSFYSMRVGEEKLD
jgi:K(+)-stimulated pyrophosphate-energized sodium pump